MAPGAASRHLISGGYSFACKIGIEKAYTMKRSIFFILLGLSILTACGGGENASNPNEVAVLEAVPAEFADKKNPFGLDAAGAGAALFKTNCETCHGPQGHGDGPAGAALNPAPKDLAELQARAGDDYLFWRISTGRQGTSMIAWRGILSEEQIWQVVSFIRALK